MSPRRRFAERRSARRLGPAASCLLALLAGCGPGYLDSRGELTGAYYELPEFGGYSGDDAALVFIAYTDDIVDYESSPTHEYGESIIVIDGQRVRPGRTFRRFSLEPGSHRFEVLLRRRIHLDPSEGYDPVNYPRVFFSEVSTIHRATEPREVWLLVTYWDSGTPGYLLVRPGTLDRVERPPPLGPETRVKVGERELPRFVIRAIHEYVTRIADAVEKL